WLVTNDVVRRDPAGRHWFVDALAGFVTTKSGAAASLRSVEDALYRIPEVALASAWDRGSGEIGAAFVAPPGVTLERLAEAMDALPPHARPTLVARVDGLSLSEGFRPDRRAASESARSAPERWTRTTSGYRPG